jgi:hypothetical protein
VALVGGHLGRLTSPIHRYLIRGGALHPNVSRQYVTDLRERWMHHPDALKRHHLSKGHDGLVVELQCAEWLETRGWTVVGLEALRPGRILKRSPRPGLSLPLK